MVSTKGKTMTHDQFFIGIDSGTQGTKAIAFSIKKKKIVARDYSGYALKENRYGGREQDPMVWINACRKVLTTIISSPEVDSHQIRAIGVSGQQHGLVPLDKHGNTIRPAKLWCDTQTESQCKTLTRVLGGHDKVIQIIGNRIAPGFTAPKLLWLKENEPQNYEKLTSILLPHDFINFWLTGEKKTEPGDASGTAYFNVPNRCWEKKILGAIDDSGKLDTCLPPIISSREPVGFISDNIAKSFNLSSGVVVSSGGGDNMMAAIGTGNVEPGVVTASLGTSGTIYAYSNAPVIDPKGEVAAFCSSSGGWLPLVCTMNVTVATELVRHLFEYDLEKFNMLAQQANPGADGIVLLPYFNGERTPALPQATASFHGLTPFNFTQRNLCRASMEGATLGLKYALEALKTCGISPKEIRLTGGGSKSSLWRQMTADILGYQVVPAMDSEAGALGAAIQAMWCWYNENHAKTGLKDLTDEYIRTNKKERCAPNPNNQNSYARIYEHYLTINDSMAPVFKNETFNIDA